MNVTIEVEISVSPEGGKALINEEGLQDMLETHLKTAIADCLTTAEGFRTAPKVSTVRVMNVYRT